DGYRCCDVADSDIVWPFIFIYLDYAPLLCCISSKSPSVLSCAAIKIQCNAYSNRHKRITAYAAHAVSAQTAERISSQQITMHVDRHWSIACFAPGRRAPVGSGGKCADSEALRPHLPIRCDACCRLFPPLLLVPFPPKRG